MPGRRPRRGSPAACPAHGGSVAAGDGSRTDYVHGLNEVSAPVVDSLGRRLTAAEARALAGAGGIADLG